CRSSLVVLAPANFDPMILSQTPSTVPASEPLERVEPGMPVLFGGDRVTRVPPEIAEAFQPGDRLLVVQSSGEVLLVPQKQHRIAAEAVGRARAAFEGMGAIADTQITQFYEEFAARLADDRVWGPIADANAADVSRARERGRSTTRLVADE